MYTIKQIRFKELDTLLLNSGLQVNVFHKIITLLANKYLMNEGNTVSINSKYFLGINHKYRDYINFLKREDIIMINEHYSNNTKTGFTKRYGFSDYFKNLDHKVEIDIGFYPSSTQSKKNIVDTTIKGKLKRDFKHLSIPSKPKPSYNSFNGVNILDFKKYLSDYINLTLLKRKQGFYNWKGSRLYTNFISCSSKTRSQFNINGNKISNFDIKSSHPLFICKVINDNYNNHSWETLGFIHEVLYEDIYQELMNIFIRYKDIIKSPTDISNSNKHVIIKSSKTEYSYLKETPKELSWHIPFYSRDLMKTYLMKIINSDKPNLNVKEPYYVFNVKYTDVYELIQKLKVNILYMKKLRKKNQIGYSML